MIGVIDHSVDRLDNTLAAVFEIFFFFLMFEEIIQARTHCSRMRTVRCSSRLLGVSAWRGCVCLPRGEGSA